MAAIFVLGADRSGTSLLAELAVRWGAYPGEPADLVAPDAANPRGYFEHVPMQELLRDLAVAVGISRWDPEFPRQVADLAGLPPWRGRARELADRMAAGGRPWMWKEPLLALYLDFWERALGEAPVCVLAIRNPHDAARSFARATFPGDLGERLRLVAYFVLRWQVLLLAALAATESRGARLLVAYEELLRAPVQQVVRLGAFLDAGVGGGDGRSAERLEEMIEAIDPGLRHQKSATSFFDLEQVLPAQKDLLHELQSGAADRGMAACHGARFGLPPYHREWLENFDVCRYLLAAAEPGLALSPRDLRRLAWRHDAAAHPAAGPAA